MSRQKKNIFQKLAAMRIKTRILELLPPHFGQAIFRLKDGEFICNHAAPDVKFLKGMDYAAADRAMQDSNKKWRWLW